MEKQEGITLVVLIITIVVMLILLTTGVNYGLNTISNMKIYQFNTELKLVKKKIDIIIEEKKIGSKAYDSIGVKVSNLQLDKKNRAVEILTSLNISANEINNFILLSQSDLSKIGITKINQEVLVNYDLNKVFSYTGIIENGKEYFIYE